ncbi:MotA/TolQ/ExbB proton channel family protein [Blautia sp.]|uniref:MotA/TolQ/ExbB proton channel domain-containing protein n=1 Tax=Blautia glucerasea TaxID=536633 RepID=A0A6N2SPS8_9FIRM
MQKKNKIWILGITFLVLGGICLYLMFTGKNIGLNRDNAINAILFIIVAWIFFYARKKMKIIVDITYDLHRAVKEIKNYEREPKDLWEKYSSDNNELFQNKELKKVYEQYISERKRLASISENKYKCDVSEYINEEFIDSLMKKNLYNLVPGVMTGLGILGTFIGLSFGLEKFNTGNTQEIEASIAPLMSGIKVAFHTSIYGMIFSLVFNYVYKDTLENAYIAVDDFLEAFSRHVDGNASDNNGIVIQMLLENMPQALSATIADILSPAMNKMNQTLENFTNNISESQVQGLSEIVDHFIESMDSAMGDSFEALGETIDKTIEMQTRNNEMMNNVLDEVQRMTTNIKDINMLSNQTVEHMAGYIEKIEGLQKVVNENFVSISKQLEYQKEYDDKLKEYIDILVNYERQIGEASNRFTEDMSKQLEILGTMENKISESTRENLEMLAAKADEYNKSLTEVAKQELQSVLSMANEYSEKVTGHLSALGDMSEKLTEESVNNLHVLSDSAQEYNEKLAQEAGKQMESILKLSNSQSGEMNRASQNLAEVSKELNGKLTLSLNNAFTAIDENLAEITRHLSGTISEIEETTDRVPQVVHESYAGMKDSFDEMKQKYEALIHVLDVMAHSLEQYRRD